MSVAPYSGIQTTYVELVVLRGLDGAVLGQALDDLHGLVELRLRHVAEMDARDVVENLLVHSVHLFKWVHHTRVFK